MYLVILLLLALLTGGIIVLLHRSQLKQRSEIVDRTAPLATVDLHFEAPGSSDRMPASDVHAPEPDGPGENWLEQVKRLRESGADDAALQLCRQQFPRIQAFQQAAVILRQLVRDHIEGHQGAAGELKELYRIAVMADLYRNSNPRKPRDPRHTLQQLQALEFDYNAIGTRHLRLLTKSDIRHFEQLWGRPPGHLHAEDCPKLDWQALCR